MIEREQSVGRALVARDALVRIRSEVALLRSSKPFAASRALIDRLEQDVAQCGSVVALGAMSRRFKSCRPEMVVEQREIEQREVEQRFA